METIRLLYPDWLIIAIIAFLFCLASVIVIYFCVSINIISYIKAVLETSNNPTIFFIKDLDGDNLVNVEEIEQVTQRYNNTTKEYEIIYFLKSGHELKETFDTGNNCSLRFMEINNILNDFNY